MATDRFLVYAAGGLAYGHTKNYGSDTIDGQLHESGSKIKSGWTVAAHAEYAVTVRISLKTEYSYTDLGKAEVIRGDPLGLPHALDRIVLPSSSPGYAGVLFAPKAQKNPPPFGGGQIIGLKVQAAQLIRRD